MITIAVSLIDDAVLVGIGVCTLDGFAVTVVELVVNVEHVGSITLGQHLNHVVVLYSRTHHHVGLLVGLHEREVLHLHFLPCEVVRHVPFPVLGLDGSGVERHLNAVAVHVAHIGGDGLAELRTCCCRNRCDKVLGLAGVEVERARDAVVDESEVEAHVPRVGGLPFKVRHVSLRTVSLYP